MASSFGVVCFIASSRKPMRVGQLGGGALECGQGLLVASPARARVRDAPVDSLGCSGKLGADLAHAVAQADHVVEAPAGELAEVLGATAGEVDAVRAHHAHRVRDAAAWGGCRR